MNDIKVGASLTSKKEKNSYIRFPFKCCFCRTTTIKELVEIEQNENLLQGPFQKLKHRKQLLDKEVLSLSKEKINLEARTRQLHAVELKQFQKLQTLAQERSQLKEQLDQLLQPYEN